MLQKFLEQTKMDADPDLIDPDLINRWVRRLCIHGDEGFKPQLTRAKRTAAALRKARCELKNLSREQVRAVDVAATEMEILTRDLERFVELQKAYSIFCEQAKKNELEEIAFERWGNDDAAMREEADLIIDLDGEAGVLAFALWVHASGWHTDVALEKIRINTSFERMNHLSLREEMAATVKRMRGVADDKYVRDNEQVVICGWEIYERYLAYRKATNYYKRTKKNELEEIAFERWGGDDEALQEEVDLIFELDGVGRFEFARWVQASGWHTDVALQNIKTIMSLVRPSHTYHDSWREEMAEIVKRMRGVTDVKSVYFKKPHVWCGWEIYESYLAYRKELARTKNRVLHIADQSS
jgi:hypothetical protein